MNNSSRNVLIVLGLIGFGIILGIDTAGRGIERIQGPMDPAALQAAAAQTAAVAPLPTPTPLPTPAPTPTPEAVTEPVMLPRGDERPKMTVIADKTGGAVQSAAQTGVELVVSLFEGLLN